MIELVGQRAIKGPELPIRQVEPAPQGLDVALHGFTGDGGPVHRDRPIPREQHIRCSGRLHHGEYCLSGAKKLRYFDSRQRLGGGQADVLGELRLETFLEQRDLVLRDSPLLLEDLFLLRTALVWWSERLDRVGLSGAVSTTKGFLVV